MLKMVLDLANSTDTVQGVTIYTMLGAMMPLSGESTELSPLPLIFSYIYEKSLCGAAKCDPSRPLAAKHCIVEDLFSRYTI